MLHSRRLRWLAALYMMLVCHVNSSAADGESEAVLALRKSKFLKVRPQVLGTLTGIISNHLSHKNPSMPLIISMHGPTGVGKSLLHEMLAQAMFGSSHQLPFFDVSNEGWFGALKNLFKEEKYTVLRAASYSKEERPRQLKYLKDKIKNVAEKSWFKWNNTPLLVIENIDKLDCHILSELRDILVAGAIDGVSLKRVIILLETNEGQDTLFDMAISGKYDIRKAQKAIKMSIQTAWLKNNGNQADDPCPGSQSQNNQAVIKMINIISYFVPFFPYNFGDIRSIVYNWFTIIDETLQQKKNARIGVESSAIDAIMDEVSFDENTISVAGVQHAVNAMLPVTDAIHEWLKTEYHEKKCGGIVKFKYCSRSNYEKFVVECATPTDTPHQEL